MRVKKKVFWGYYVKELYLPSLLLFKFIISNMYSNGHKLNLNYIFELNFGTIYNF
jgi:hypothetical protein